MVIGLVIGLGLGMFLAAIISACFQSFSSGSLIFYDAEAISKADLPTDEEAIFVPVHRKQPGSVQENIYEVTL